MNSIKSYLDLAALHPNGVPGGPGTINIVVWESYSDSACGNLDDDFTTSDTVYMHGTGLAVGYSYKVAYYAGINYHSAYANVVATSAGNLSTDEPTDLYFLG